MIDEKRIKRFIEGAKEAFKEVDDATFTFPMTILSAYELATSIEELLKKQEAKKVICIANSIEGREVGFCPSCDKSIVNIKIDETKFCKFCGQAVKWDE